MSAAQRNIPGGTIILLAILVLPIVWLFATQETDSEKRSKAQAEFAAQIPRSGTVGTWYDDLGSKDFADATITITGDQGKYSALRVSGDGSQTTLKLSRSSERSNVFVVENDKFGASYVLTSVGLEIHDRDGYIRTAKVAVHP